jgi:hypothetical protein
MIIKKILSILFVAGALPLLMNDTLNARQCCGGGMKGYMNYDRDTVETIEGTVVNVATFMRGGIHVTLKTAKGDVDAHLGPDFFVKEKIKIAKGDVVEIVGSRIEFNGSKAIIAKSIKKGDVVVQLRKDDGTPLWAGEGRRRQ